MNNIEGIEFLKRQFVFLESVLKHGKFIFKRKRVCHKLFLLLFIIRCVTFKYCGVAFLNTDLKYVSYSDLILHFGKVESFYYMYEQGHEYPSGHLELLLSFLLKNSFVTETFARGLYRRFLFRTFTSFNCMLKSPISMASTASMYSIDDILKDVQGFLDRVEVERESKSQIDDKDRDSFNNMITGCMSYINSEDISVVHYCLIFNLYIQLQIVYFGYDNTSNIPSHNLLSYFNANMYNKFEYKNILDTCIKEISAYDLRFTRVKLYPLVGLANDGDYILDIEYFVIFVDFCRDRLDVRCPYVIARASEAFLVKFFSDMDHVIDKLPDNHMFCRDHFEYLYGLYITLFTKEDFSLQIIDKADITGKKLLVEVVRLFKKLLQDLPD